jgi:peptidyl-prolyl cis-trans isomerase C
VKALAKISGQPKNSKLAASLADRFMFQDYYGDRAPEQLAKEFGPKFAQALFQAKPGSWQGPIAFSVRRFRHSRPHSGLRKGRV